MAEKENITSPSMGSNPLGEEIRADDKGMPAGTDTQTKLAALSTDNSDTEKDSGNRIKSRSGENDFDEHEVVDGRSEFLEANETDE
jgi:hypothetical protein